MIPYTSVYKEGADLLAGITGWLYQDKISTDVTTAIAPFLDGEYSVLTMTGAVSLREVQKKSGGTV